MASSANLRPRTQPTAPRRAGLLAGTALQAAMWAALALPAAADPAPNALPLGGSVTAGSAKISSTPTTTTITQSSQRAAINWQSFDVGAQQTVDFVQPSSSAVALNRVVGPNPSQIAGRIDADGQVILINQDGVTFYKGAQVNAAGLVVSAVGMTNQNFMAGRMVLDQPAHAGARIANAGTITVGQAGLAALVAPAVANSGMISGKLGHVVLAGASTATLDLYGDGLINFDVSNQVMQGPGGTTALVTNTGTILAAGGTVQLTARAADGVVQTLIQAGGTISAPSVAGQSGTIVLAGIGGDIAINGQVLAQGTAPGTSGGAIQILPSGTANLASGARIDASGVAGGGTIALGTTLARAAGGPSVTARQTATAVAVAAGASIAADATGQGDGGRITLLSADSTVMAGSISARGGPDGGNGGFVEVSGGSLGYNGTIDVGAPLGAPGTALFDPATLDIQTAAGNDDLVVGTPTITGGTTEYIIPFTLNPGSSDTVSVGALEAINNGTIILQATSLLEVKNSVTFNSGVAAVTMESGGNLIVDPSRSLVMPGATGSLVLAATGTLGLTSATLNAPSLMLSGNAGGITLDGASITATALALTTTGGNIGEAATGTLDVGALTIATTSGGSVTLSGSANDIGTLEPGSVAATLSVTNDAALMVDGPLNATAITLTALAGDLTLAGSITGTNDVALTASLGNITQESGGISTASLSANASGSLDLGSMSNTFALVTGATAANGNLTLTNGGNLTLAGTASGQNVAIEAASHGAVLTLGSGAVAATITATASGGGVSLTADQISEPLTPSIATGSSAGTGSVSIAPFSSNPVSLLPGTGLLIDATLLGGIHTGTLIVGNANTIGVVSSISIGAALNLTAIGVGTLDLLTGGGITQAGALAVGSLAATASGGVTLDSPTNQIGTLAGVSAGPSLSVTSDAALMVKGPLNATAITLTALAGNLTLAGNVDGTTSVALTASAGNITQSGSAVTAGTLTASALSGSIDLGSTLNAIDTADSAAALSSVTIANGFAMTVSGPVSAGTVTLSVLTGDLTLAGSITGTTDLALTATAGNVIQSGGTIITGSLAGSATGSFDLGLTVNAVTALGSISAGPSLVVASGTAMTVNGPVSATAVALSTETGDLTLAGSITGTTDLALTATAGNVIQSSGTVIAGSLAGSATGSFDLDMTVNTIGTVTGATAGTGNLVLTNGTDLTLTGTESGQNVTLEVAAAGGTLALGSGAVAATVTATGGGGDIALLADRLSDVAGSTLVDAGTLAIAPFSSNPVSLLSGSGLLLDATLLNEISTATLVVGSTTTATGIAVGGAVTLATQATTLDLLASGSIAEPGGSLGVSVLTATANGITLDATTNAIGTLNAVSAGSGNLVLTNGTDLTLAGALSGQNITLDIAAAGGTLAVGRGAVAATVTATGGGDIALIADRITDIAGSAVSDGGTLAIAPFSANAISLAGTPGAQLLLDATLLGAISTPTLAVGSTTTATGISVDGAVDLTNHATTLNLLTSGSVAEPGGPLTVGTLTAAAGTGIALGTTTNAIGTLDSASSAGGGIVVADGSALTIAGPVRAGTVTLASAGALDVLAGVTGTGGLVLAGGTGLTLAGSAPVTAPAIQLNGGTAGITLSGTGIVGGAGSTLDLIGSGGLTEAATSTIQATLLTSSAGIAGTVALGGTANAIAVLGGFAVTGGDLDLADGGAGTLTVAGPVSAINIALGSTRGLPATLDVTGRIAATQTLSLAATSGIALGTGATLDGQSIAFVGGGPVTFAAGAAVGDATAAVSVSSAGGAVIEASGANITAATLDSAGGIAGAATFGGTANAIATLENLSAASLLLADGAPTLTIAGRVTAGGNVLIGSATQPGTIGLAGTLTGQAVTLDAGLGGIRLAGSLDAGTVAELDAAGGGVDQSGGFVAATLQSAGITGPVRFASATVGTLGEFPVANGGLTLSNSAGIVLTGPISADGIAIGSAGGMGVGGTLTAAGALALTTSQGGIALGIGANAALLDAGTVTLAAAGQISEPNGIITAGTLAASGTIAVNLGNGNNSVATLGAVSVPGGNFLLVDNTAPLLTVAGPVAAGSVTLGTPATLTLAGSIVASGEVSLSAGSGGISFGSGAAPGTVMAGSLALNSGGTIGEPNGLIVATRLQASSTGTLGLDDAGNDIATLGTITVAGGDVVLADRAPLLTVLGPVSAADITIGTPTALTVLGTITDATGTSLAAGSGGMTIAGALEAGTLTLVSLGSISEPGGSITAATLTGSSLGATTLGGPGNAIGLIPGFTAGTKFLLADSIALTLSGTLTAPLVELDMPASTFTLADGAAMVTGGIAQPADYVLLDASVGGALLLESEVPTTARPAQSGGQPVGAYLAVGSFTQLGISRIDAIAAGGDSILRIDAAGAGSIIFADLQGPGTWLLIGIDTGKIVGNIFVKSLTLQYPTGYSGATLSGTVNQIAGEAAAAEATILPLPSDQFRLNNCPIHSINCVLLPTESLPTASPLQNFSIGALLNNNDDDYLLLPIVSSEDY